MVLMMSGEVVIVTVVTMSSRFASSVVLGGVTVTGGRVEPPPVGGRVPPPPRGTVVPPPGGTVVCGAAFTSGEDS